MRKKDSDKEVDGNFLEHDISLMDPALFEDPILMLEYFDQIEKKDSPGRVISGTSLKKSIKIEAEFEDKHTLEKNPWIAQEGNYTKRIFGVLQRAKEDLDLYGIQDRSGINDLDIIIDVLNDLCQSGKVIRKWSRKYGGRSVYCLNAKNQDNVSIVLKDDLKDNIRNPERVTEYSLEDAIMSTLKLTGYPIDLETLQRKSIVLMDANPVNIRLVLSGLRDVGKIEEIWNSQSNKFYYSINDQVTRDVSGLKAHQAEGINKFEFTRVPIQGSGKKTISKVSDKPKTKNKVSDAYPGPNNYLIESEIISVLESKYPEYLALSEIYENSSDLPQNKRKLIWSILQGLINKSIIESKLLMNKFGAYVLKYRVIK